MLGDLLQTKFHIPSSRSTLVARPRLVEQIDRGVRAGCRLTLVSAPAGFGKTTLVTEWLSRYPNHDTEPSHDGAWVAWLSLDEEDNDIARFLAYLVAALQQLDKGVGDAAVVMLQAPQPPPIESIMTSLLNDIVDMERGGRSKHPYVLVLDDYHLITSSAIHNAVTFLLENVPRHLHLVLSTRSDPPLPLSRLRVRGQMTEIRQADLQFTSVETGVFLNDVMSLSLTTNHVEALEARTEGWIAGLQLAALSMRGRGEIAEFVEAFSGSHRFVMDYLIEEVINGQPDDLRRFILETSILGRLSGPLCEAVTGQNKGQELVERLEGANLFIVPLDGDRIWFRYHHLFADVMASRLQRLSPNRVPELHLRAAQWFLQQNLLSEAFGHALAGGDHQLAAEIVESQALNMLKAGSLTTLLGWLNKLPPQTVNERPRLAVASAWVYLLIGKSEHIEGHLSAAEEQLEDLQDNDDLWGEIAAIRTYSAARMGKLDRAIEQAQIAFDLLAEDNLSVRCVVAFVVGGVYFMQQDIPRALEAIKEAGQLGERAGNIHLAVSAYSTVGDLLHRQGKLAESERAFHQAMHLGSGRGGRPLPIAASAHSGLAALRLTQKDFAGARSFALIGLDLAGKWVNVDSQAGCYLTLARLEYLEGNLEEAREALENAKHLATTHQLTPSLQEQIAAYEAMITEASATGTNPDLPEPLNEHELKVLRLVAAGLSNREVAEELYLSVNTVKWHLKHTYEKLDVHSRVAAVTRAQELGLL